MQAIALKPLAFWRGAFNFFPKGALRTHHRLPPVRAHARKAVRRARGAVMLNGWEAVLVDEIDHDE
jgi:hypothetical protein